MMKKLNLKKGPARIFQCPNCHRIHFEYGSIALDLELNDFWKFSWLIQNPKNFRKNTSFYVIPVVHQSVFLKIHESHYPDVRGIVIEAVHLLKTEYLLSSGELLDHSTMDDTYWSAPHTKVLS